MYNFSRIKWIYNGRCQTQRVADMTFIEFKKLLLDAEITLPKFCELIKVSDKNIQSYKKKGTVPNTIAVIATCIVELHKNGIGYKPLIENLKLKKKTKTGGFAKKKANSKEKNSKKK